MKMEYSVSEISIFEYLTGCAGLRTALSDFYVKTRKCFILGARGGDRGYAGFMIAEPGSITEILFIIAEGEDSEIKKALLDGFKGRSPAGTGIRWRIANSAENEQIAAEYGFMPEGTLNIFRTVGPDDEQLKALLTEYGRLYVAMESMGYRTVSFGELSQDELRQIRENPDGEFDDSLNPGALMGDTAGGFSSKLSFASVRDGKVAAYSIIRDAGGKSCIFEIVCVAQSLRRQGLFILPFYSSFRAIVESGKQSAVFAVYEHNAPMMKLLEERIGGLIRSRTVQHNMILFV